MSVEFRAIREDEREACLDLWCAVWPGEGSRDHFRRYFYGDVEWLPYYTQVAVEDGRLVSAVHICKRTVACGDFRLTLGGIANVVTLPEYRGRGYSTACLERAIAVMEADAMDLSLLFTGINGYYARLGFADLPMPWLQGTVRGSFMPRPTALTVRPAADDDLPAIRAIYDDYNRQRPIAVQRYEAYWREWIGLAPGRIPETWLVAVQTDGRVCGYVHYKIHKSHVTIDEMGIHEVEWTEPEIAAALLDVVAANAHAAGYPGLNCLIPAAPAVREALSDSIVTLRDQTITDTMVRLLHRDNLLRSFAMEWNDRWIAAGRPSGALTFATPYGPTQVDAQGSFLRVQPVEEMAGILSQSTLFGLLLGLLSPEQATPNSDLHPLLAALFPPHAAIYWNADGF